MSIRRIAWLVAVFIALILYFPINRVVSGGIELKLGIDDSIPLWSPAIVPYLLGILLFIGAPIWAAIYAKPREFKAYAVSIILLSVVSYVIFVAFPTFVTRPEIESGDIFSVAIDWLYRNDEVNNAAPSGHTFYTLLAFLYFRRWYPRYQFLWLVLAISIITSTVLTGQHYVLDVVTGLAFGFLGYRAVRIVMEKFHPRSCTGESS